MSSHAATSPASQRIAAARCASVHVPVPVSGSADAATVNAIVKAVAMKNGVGVFMHH
jgi:hypothetical protein